MKKEGAIAVDTNVAENAMIKIDNVTDQLLKNVKSTIGRKALPAKKKELLGKEDKIEKEKRMKELKIKEMKAKQKQEAEKKKKQEEEEKQVEAPPEPPPGPPPGPPEL